MIESKTPSVARLMPPCSRGGAAHATEIETRLKSNISASKLHKFNGSPQ